MSNHEAPESRALRRQEASDQVGHLGWRYVLGALCAYVLAGSLARAAEVAAHLVAGAGADADGHLRVDLRHDRLVLTVQTPHLGHVTAVDVALAQRLSALAADLGLRTDAGAGAAPARSVQLLEIAVDALDIPAVRPFWKAVLGYVDESPAAGPEAALVDPVGQGPAVWFQQMTEPRPQRNRIHLDISVPHDEAPGRIERALAAGGVLVSDAEAPAFWVLADVEGNEACVTTWQGRDQAVPEGPS